MLNIIARMLISGIIIIATASVPTVSPAQGPEPLAAGIVAGPAT